MIVLIITHSGDNESVESVARAVAERGGRAVRLDTDRFPSEVRLAARYGGGDMRVTFDTGGGGFDLNEVGAVWHRRLSVAARLPRELDAQLRAASVGESRAALLGVLAGLTAFRVDHEQAIRRAEQKPLQLRVARELGLEVPRTLVTNDPSAVREFYAACGGRIITKMLSSFAVYDQEGREHVVFTNPVGPEDLEDLTGLSLCPMTFQERVEKRLRPRRAHVRPRGFTPSAHSPVSTAAARHAGRAGGVPRVERVGF